MVVYTVTPEDKNGMLWVEYTNSSGYTVCEGYERSTMEQVGIWHFYNVFNLWDQKTVLYIDGL